MQFLDQWSICATLNEHCTPKGLALRRTLLSREEGCWSHPDKASYLWKLQLLYLACMSYLYTIRHFEMCFDATNLTNLTFRCHMALDLKQSSHVTPLILYSSSSYLLH